MIDLTGRTALVTGGSRGIGRACGLLLARAGARVALSYRADRAAADEVVERIRAEGGQAEAWRADVASAGDADRLVERTVERFGGVDVLVNNAGIWTEAPIDAMSDAQWSETIAVNLTGTFYATRAAARVMRAARSGRIVHVSSTAGQRGEARHSHYAATKGGIIAFTKSLAVELAPYGITVNCVAPGWTDTDMAAAALRGPDRASILAAIPLGRPARPEEIAAGVLFLASDLASFVTGEIFNINGGAVLAG